MCATKTFSQLGALLRVETHSGEGNYAQAGPGEKEGSRVRANGA